MELFSARLQMVIWSYAFVPGRLTDAREIAVLVREIQESLWLQSVSSIKFYLIPLPCPQTGCARSLCQGTLSLEPAD